MKSPPLPGACVSPVVMARSCVCCLLSHSVEWLSDNGSAYIAKDTLERHRGPNHNLTEMSEPSCR